MSSALATAPQKSQPKKRVLGQRTGFDDQFPRARVRVREREQEGRLLWSANTLGLRLSQGFDRANNLDC